MASAVVTIGNSDGCKLTLGLLVPWRCLGNCPFGIRQGVYLFGQAENFKTTTLCRQCDPFAEILDSERKGNKVKDN